MKGSPSMKKESKVRLDKQSENSSNFKQVLSTFMKNHKIEPKKIIS